MRDNNGYIAKIQLPKELILAWSKIENKKKVYKGIVATVSVSIISAIIPYFYGRLVDLAINLNSSIKLIIGIIALWTTLSLIRDWVDRIGVKFAYEIANDIWTKLHVDAALHLVSLPLQFHKEKKMGEVENKINRGTEDLYNIIEETLFSFVPAILTFFIALVILLFAEWRLAIILIISSIAYVGVTLIYTKEIVVTQKILNKFYEKSFGDRYDAIFNVEAVKSTTNEEFEYKRNQINFTKAKRAYNTHRFLWLKMDRWQSAIFTLSFIAVFSIGVFMLRAGHLTPGKLIMFVGYIGLLTAPLSRVANQYRRIKRALASFKRLADLFGIAQEKDSANAIDIKNIKGEVKFENVNFSYKKEKGVLQSISFNANAGESIALVGKSGVGKTTLVNLIGRYYFSQKGKILIDGIDIRKFKLKFLRSNMAVVPQEVLLFNDTIKNNIKYGNPKASEKEIIEAAKAANASEFIESFPKKYNQLVGERGIKLSTGQKQRVAIARAILRNPKILILDEATSALDSVSEKLVQEALSRLVKGRTTFVIAHRLSTIKNADKIIVLEKGKIAEIGNHDDLIKNPQGTYRNFWELQSAI